MCDHVRHLAKEAFGSGNSNDELPALSLNGLRKQDLASVGERCLMFARHIPILAIKLDIII